MKQVLYIPHGGGPLPLLGDPGYARLATALRKLNATVEGARAIILVTAHWEADHPTIATANKPGMLFDYYGFPEAAYQIDYPAPGAPEIAESVAAALNGEGFSAQFDPDRGFDHGTFIPMALIRPQADIPILQMSLLSSLDPAAHLAMGRALANLPLDNVVLIGSGFSFHNLGALTGRLKDDGQTGPAMARAFHDWLDDVVCGSDHTPADRARDLVAWEAAPGARYCHPREEHLLPLHVCYGAASAKEMTARTMFSEPVKGFQTSGYHWQ